MSAQLAKLNMLLGNLDVGFAHLNSTNRLNNTFSQVFDRITSIMRGSIIPRTSRSGNAAHNTGSKHYGYVENFKAMLMKAGVPLEKMYISHQGISFLKDFLHCCGFPKSDIHRLISELLDAGYKGKKEIKGINILELFAKLSELKTTVDRNKKDPVLDASAIPHLEVVLNRLGINARDVKKVLSEGRSADGYLNLESLLQSLRHILDNADQVYGVSSSDKLAEDIKQILSPLGMNEENEKIHGVISLDKFIQLLEETISKLRKSNVPNNQNVEKAVRHLIGEVVVDSEESDSRLQFQSLTTQGLIDDLLGSKDKKKAPDVKDTRVFSQKRGEKYTIHKTNFDAISTHAEKFSRMLEHGSNDEQYRAMWGGTQKINISETVAENRPFTVSIKAVQSPTISSSRSLPLYVVDQVSHQISRSIMQGKDNIRLRLKPPHLGTVKLDMEMKGNVLKLDVGTESQVTKELLLSYIQELKQTLGEQGIRLERMDIHANYQFGESMKNNQKEQNGEGDWARGRSSSSSTILRIGREESEKDATVLRPRMDSRLDLIA